MTDTQVTLKNFFEQFPQKGFPKHHVVIAANKPTQNFYFIETGAVKMAKTSPEGKNLNLHIFFPGSFFSLMSLNGEVVNQYDFITLQPTTVRIVPQAELIDFLKSNNDVMFELQTRLLKGLSGLLKRIEDSALIPAYQRVASLLLYFASHFSETSEEAGQSSSKKLHVKITHQEIADWLGLSRENVSIHMKHLEENSLISINNHLIEILDVDELRKMSTNSDNE